MTDDELPPGLEKTRTTPVFSEHTVPAGLLAAHQIAAGVWGRLMVRSGMLGFVFEDEPDAESRVEPSAPQIIPPQRPHHVVLRGPVEFSIEFHRQP